MLNLKDRIGEDSIRDLAPNGLVELFKSNRVWVTTKTTTILKDNIAYKSTNLPSSNDLIQSTELRPAISFSSIIDLMIKKSTVY
jgi:hypothetical protein